MTAFVVRRQALDGGSFCRSQFADDTGSRVPVRLFLDRATAEAHAAELHARAARSLNPFALWVRSDSPGAEDDFRRALRKLGLTPPPAAEREWQVDWVGWWDALQETLTDAQRAGVWALFAERPLYEVAEVELEE